MFYLRRLFLPGSQGEETMYQYYLVSTSSECCVITIFYAIKLISVFEQILDVGVD
jgi:hypothetical protein